MLGEISEDEGHQGRPMLSALAVSSTNGKPGRGFYVLARQLGLLEAVTPQGERRFWEAEVRKVYAVWGER